MNAPSHTPNFSDALDALRDAGLLAMDHPGRKLAIFADGSGLICLFGIEGGDHREGFFFTITPEEVARTVELLNEARQAALAMSEQLDVELRSFKALERAVSEVKGA